MNTTSRWVDRSHPQMHPSIARLETRTEVRTLPGTDLTALARGDSVTLVPPREEVNATQDDRVTFKNGAVLEDGPGESGMILTLPSGEQQQVPGWLDLTGDCNIFVHGEEDAVWQQSLSGNQTRFEFDPGCASDDKLYGRMGLNGNLSIGARREGPIVILAEAEALNPVVPLEWLVTERGRAASRARSS